MNSWKVVALLAVALGINACGEPSVSDMGNDRTLTPTPTPSNGRHHPDGWAAADTHGLAAKFVQEDCRSCHGLQLDGGPVGVSCDGCHQPNWKTTCTFCHGGTDNQTGAPPRDITNATAIDQLVFR